MKKILIILVLYLAAFPSSLVQAETIYSVRNEVEISKKEPSSVEKVFTKKASECLEIMERSANGMSISGVAMIAYIPGNTTESWLSEMKVVGKLATNDVNFLAVVYGKAAEMAVTLLNSGNESRKDIIGETGWQGGVIRKVNKGYLVAAFSGGTGEQDVEVSTAGLDWLSKFY